MGLDVGVVSIQYLERPGQPMYRFLQDLMVNPKVGMSADEDDAESAWGGSWEGNAFYEFHRDALTKRANGWADQNDVNEDARAMLINWLINLPGQSDHIMLHLGN